MKTELANFTLNSLDAFVGAVAAFKSKLEKKASGPDRVRVSP